MCLVCWFIKFKLTRGRRDINLFYKLDNLVQQININNILILINIKCAMRTYQAECGAEKSLLFTGTSAVYGL